MKAVNIMGIYLLLSLFNLLIVTGYCLVNSLGDYYLTSVMISELILIPVSILIANKIK
jgi:hypothetical protein